MRTEEFYREICRLPVIDVHSHLPRDGMAAADLEAILFYHMLRYPLRSAGMNEELLWDDPQKGMHSPTPRDIDKLYDQWLAHWPTVENTGFGWMLRTILRELYDFDQPLSAESLKILRDAFSSRNAQPDWPIDVLQMGNIVRVLSSAGRPHSPKPDQWSGMRFTLEVSPTIGTHEYESWQSRFAKLQEWTGLEITSLDRLEEAVESFLGRFTWDNKLAYVSWVSSLCDFQPARRSVLQQIILDVRAGHIIPNHAAALLEAHLLRTVCRFIRQRVNVFQLVYGTQFLTPGRPHPVLKSDPGFIGSIGHLFAEFPELHFNILSGYEYDEPMWCAMCLAYANVSLGSFWWHSFYPSVMRSAWNRRLDMVPTSRLAGFFSDGYCVDWIFGRDRLTRRVLAEVLAEKIERGYLTTNQALRMAGDILLETPRKLFLPDESV